MAKQIQFKTTWDFLDCTHPDSMYLTFNPYTLKGSFIGGEKLTLEEKLYYHKIQIERLKNELIIERSKDTHTYGVKWANKNQQAMKTRNIRILVAQKKTHEEAIKNIKKILTWQKEARKQYNN